MFSPRYKALFVVVVVIMSSGLLLPLVGSWLAIIGPGVLLDIVLREWCAPFRLFGRGPGLAPSSAIGLGGDRGRAIGTRGSVSGGGSISGRGSVSRGTSVPRGGESGACTSLCRCVASRFDMAPSITFANGVARKGFRQKVCVRSGRAGGILGGGKARVRGSGGDRTGRTARRGRRSGLCLVLFPLLL